jgi:hypothetical protein
MAYCMWTRERALKERAELRRYAEKLRGGVEPHGRRRYTCVNSWSGSREARAAGGEYHSSHCEAVRCDGGMLTCLCMLVSSNGSPGKYHAYMYGKPLSLAPFHLYHQGIKEIAHPCPCTMHVMNRILASDWENRQWETNMYRSKTRGQ